MLVRDFMVFHQKKSSSCKVVNKFGYYSNSFLATSCHQCGRELMKEHRLYFPDCHCRHCVSSTNSCVYIRKANALERMDLIDMEANKDFKKFLNILLFLRCDVKADILCWDAKLYVWSDLNMEENEKIKEN